MATVLKMGRGTTPIYCVKFTGVDISEIGDIYITFRQKRNARVLTKHFPEVVPGEGYAHVQLSQKETLSFRKGEGEAQVRLLDKLGNAYKTVVIPMEVSDVLHERSLP